ncbi:hypothetical protein B0H63DRAFT_565766 [Podospora didyma]|uniref:Secreted protein n=1 Tax=Podospora didyma TaxID=330526 RepID=A0AAE0K1R8_9PEZI|nr:hypothetical protein B0H63DRAFT_565766 [Podospora didyma]
MKATLLFAILTAIPGALSGPLDTAAVDPVGVLKKEYDIYWCKETHYEKCKKYNNADVKYCYDLEGEYNNNCKSVKHEKDVTCYYYQKKSCDGDYLKASGDYKELPDHWKDKISSWYCKEDDD